MKIEEDRESRPDVYRRGSSGAARREELINNIDSLRRDIQRMVERFKEKFETYLTLEESLPYMCTVGAVGACAYTGNIMTAIKIIGGIFGMVIMAFTASIVDSNVPLSVEDRMFSLDFLRFYMNRVKPKLD